MVVTTDAETRLLDQFGLTAVSEQVWRYLLADPSARAEEIAKQLRLTTGEVDQAIGELLEASLVRSESAPLGVVANNPALALEAHMARAEREAANQSARFAELRAALPSLASAFSGSHTSAGDLPPFEVIVSKWEIQRQIDLAVDGVKVDVRSMDHQPSTELWPDEVANQIRILGQGVRDRLLLSPESIARAGIFEHVLTMQQRGHDSRAHQMVATRVIIIDRDFAALAVDPSSLELGAMILRIPSLVDLLATMYDEMWENATPIFSDPSVGDAPIGRHARILELIALGNKDEAISRSLGIGVRTIRRDVSDLKTGLGVSSRAEIVAAAVRKGWL
jgi:DNA-binding CsgD family transcriptional regulator/sugar-specific transcriptional regulator TrmB